jgi:hypothetical protein
MKRVAVTILIGCLVLSLNISTATAAVKPGSTCKKLGQIITSAGIKYTCIKSGKKFVWSKGVRTKSASPTAPESSSPSTGATSVSTCPTPLLQTPVDLSKVSSILYPGQERGGNYKAHGGFGFDNATDNLVTVKIPLNGKISPVVRYREMGEIQYLFEFDGNCGVSFRFDHLRKLTPKFEAVVNAFPIKEDTPFHPASPYAISKVGTDLIGRYFAEAFGLKTITTRMFTHTGPRRGDVFDESSFAKRNAELIGANHTEVRFNIRDAKNTIIKLIESTGEPFSDAAYIPLSILCQSISGKHKVVLAGEGADEIFGGYTWQHQYFEEIYNKDWLRKIKSLFKKRGTVNYYAHAMSMGWFDKNELEHMLTPALHQYIPSDVHWFYRKHYNNKLTRLKSIQYLDMKCFMGELVLTKIDRASMANSLEVRVPFLDHKLFEKVFLLDEKQYFKQHQTKFLLYENIKKFLPQSILDRKKQGFVGPDNYYMNIEYYKKELANSNLVKHNIINQSYIDNLLKQDYNWKLWKILIMEKWFSHWVD